MAKKMLCVQTEKDLEKVRKAFDGVKGFSFDLETTGVDFMTDNVVSVALFAPAVGGVFIDLRNFSMQKAFVYYFESLFQQTKTITQNGVFDFSFLCSRMGMALPKKAFVRDTMVAAWLLGEEELGLKKLAKKYLGVDRGSYEDICPDNNWDTVDFEVWADYNIADARDTYYLFVLFLEKLREQALQATYLWECSVIPLIVEMQVTGTKIDVEKLKILGKTLKKEIEEIKLELQGAVDYPFNPNSSQQIAKVLYEDHNFPILKRTTKGAPSTSEGVLKIYAKYVPFVELLLKYRGFTKLHSTYVVGLAKRVYSDGRIHPSFCQTFTKTGRFNSTNPNAQNIPVGVVIRSAFVAGEGRKFIVADYSQIELRVLAHFSEDEFLIQAFKDGKDLHVATAEMLFGRKATEADRTAAKTLNFGILYGMHVSTLAKNLEIPVLEAMGLMKRFFSRFKTLGDWKSILSIEGFKDGYVTTLLGRKCFIANDDPRRNNMYVDYVCQGSAADIIKMAMVTLRDALPFEETKIISQVHDELIIEVPEEKAEEFAVIVKKSMENVCQLKVPIEVDVQIVDDWGQVT